MTLRGADPIAWFAGGYTSGGPEWLWILINAVMLGVPLAVTVWITWRVFKSGPKPVRDALLTWVTLGASAVCAGVAYPRDPEMLIPALICAVLAVGCSVRVRKHGSAGLFGVAVAAWIAWLPASGILAIALR